MVENMEFKKQLVLAYAALNILGEINFVSSKEITEIMPFGYQKSVVDRLASDVPPEEYVAIWKSILDDMGWELFELGLDGHGDRKIKAY